MCVDLHHYHENIYTYCNVSLIVSLLFIKYDVKMFNQVYVKFQENSKLEKYKLKKEISCLCETTLSLWRHD